MNRIAIGSLVIGFIAAVVLLGLSLTARSAEAAGQLTDINWVAEDLNGRGVIDYAQTTLLIGPSGAASGSGGCNRFATTATINGAKISFKPAAATRMMCAPAVMDQEQKFFAVLEEARTYSVEAATGKLFLYDKDGKIVARLSR
ncbi:META domain-containing protein [Phyllobacterium sp. BT25]|uniref:META domain-containing protein n=1 Tax=Phyllobacterium pellucidum TaxID=2740464 RepID=A0A849VII1_9HYPH|nr:META domain-containing protein [Phyllobacterium pellucidum]NTS30005.1 META domain-containing protein [Phyllobacterium pellucidum]